MKLICNLQFIMRHAARQEDIVIRMYKNPNSSQYKFIGFMK